MGIQQQQQQRSGSAPAPFLTKTYQLVDDPITDEVVSWNETGTTFVVWNMAEFTKDLLPTYFKHSNFSSFVRQLNTYGFKKIVPDKWEFANDNFKRGHKELLTEIRRRKPAPSPHPTPAAPSNSGDDQGSTSTSPPPDSKNPVSGETSAMTSQFADLADENEKLKREKELLSSELAQTKKRCDEMIAFLTRYLNVGSDQIDRIMRQADPDAATGGGGEDGSKLKLFGVWLDDDDEKKKKKKKKKKRGREENVGLTGPGPDEIKVCN